jgi:hypothetical protein
MGVINQAHNVKRFFGWRRGAQTSALGSVVGSAPVSEKRFTLWQAGWAPIIMGLSAWFTLNSAQSALMTVPAVVMPTGRSLRPGAMTDTRLSPNPKPHYVAWRLHDRRAQDRPNPG